MNQIKVKERKRQEIICIAIIISFLSLIFWKEIALQKVVGWAGGDNSLHVLAYRQEVISFIKSSKTLPFWTTKISAGFPLAADPAVASFYPVDWFFYLIFSPPAALNYSIFFHYFLASLGVFYFLKHLKFKPFSSLFGTISFVGSSYFLGIADNISILAATAWFPLVFLFFEKAFEKRNLFSTCLAGLVLGLQIFAGYPQASFLSLLLIFFWFLYRFFQKKDYHLFLYFLLPVIVGLILALPQILLSFELLPFTPRSTGFLAQALANSLSPLSLASLLLPGLFKGIPVTIGKDAFYFGIPSLIFLIFAVSFLYKLNWQVRFFTLTFLLSTLLSLGKYGLIYYLLGSIPGFNLFRVPEQFLTLAIFSASVLTTFGFSELLERQKEKSTLLKIKLIILLTLALFGLAFLISLSLKLFEPNLIPLMHKIVKEKIYEKPPHLYPLSYYYAKFDFVYQSLQTRLSPLSFTTLIPLLSLFFLFVSIANRNVLKKDSIAKFIILLLLIEMFSVNFSFKVLPEIDFKSFQSQPEAVKLLKKDCSLYRIYSWPARLKFGLLHEEEKKTRETEKAYDFVSENLLANFPLRYGISTVQGVEALWFKRHEKLLNLIESKDESLSEKEKIKRLDNFAPTLGLLNVKYIITPFPLKSSSFVQIYKTKKKEPTYVYQNKNFLPRAFLVSDYETLPADKILLKLTQKSFEPLKKVFLEEKPSGFKKSSKNLRGSVEIEKYQPFYIKIKAKAPNDCFLVLSDTYYPNWKAKVNGEKAHIYQAYYLLRAVPLSKGVNEVEFFYPLGKVKVAMSISSITLLLFFISGLIGLVNKFANNFKRKI